MDPKTTPPQEATPKKETPKKSFKFPTEIVDLPSKGITYPKDNPLSSGKIEMKYMTAKEEDIITNQALYSKGIIVDKLLEALVVSEGVDIEDMIVGDKNALLVASRVLGYGSNYKFTYAGEDYEVDLASLENKKLDESLYTKGENKFTFQTPHGENLIEFQLMTDSIICFILVDISGDADLFNFFKPLNSASTFFSTLSVIN